MPRVSTIVQFINDSLAESVFADQRFEGKGLYGISVQLPRTMDDGELDFVHAIVDEQGNTILDNCFWEQNQEPLRVFHRIIGSAYSTPPDGDGFGSHIEFTRRIAMSMVVFADKKTVQLAAEDIELMLVAGFPSTVPNADLPGGIHSVSIIPTASDLNAARVMFELFRHENSSLEPEAVLLEFKYQIEYTTNKQCIKMLCCP